MLQYLHQHKLIRTTLKHWNTELKKANNCKRKEKIKLLIKKLEKELQLLNQKITPFILSQPPMLRLIFEEVYLRDKSVKDAIYENIKLDINGNEIKFENYEDIFNINEDLEYDGDDDKPFKKAYEKYTKQLSRACYKWDLENVSKMGNSNDL